MRSLFRTALLAFAWVLLAGVLFVPARRAHAQETPRPAVRVDQALLPPGAFEKVEFLNVRDADLRDVLRSL